MKDDIVKDLLMISKIPSTKNLPSRPQIQGTCADAAKAITRLRKAIEEAPHANWCPAYSLSTIGGGIGADGVSSIEVIEIVKPRGECICWKRKALEGK